jgi:hypothetical protein
MGNFEGMGLILGLGIVTFFTLLLVGPPAVLGLVLYYVFGIGFWTAAGVTAAIWVPTLGIGMYYS